MISTEQLKQFVKDNPSLVTFKESVSRPGLFVVKYKNKVFYDNLWTDELVELRGLVVDKDFNIVVYPFTKIFNYNENGTVFDPREPVIAVEKVNGFMACLTNIPGHGMVVSTTGSLDSEYVTLASKWLQPIELNHDFTFIFEICDPSDPHIIKEVSGVYLIGVRNLSSKRMLTEEELDNEADFINTTLDDKYVQRPKWSQKKFEEVLASMPSCGHEGYVCRSVTDRNKTLKLKSPYYLTTKFLARKTEAKFLDLITNKDIKKTLPEEYYGLIDYLTENKTYFASLQEQERIDYINSYLKTAHEILIITK